jgi:hypothetical protein
MPNMSYCSFESTKALFDYLKEWGEMNDMSAKEVMAEFDWRSMTDELGLPRY